jgi:hypothetical protein
MVLSGIDGILKNLHLPRCNDFSFITTYLSTQKIMKKSSASYMKLFKNPSNKLGIYETISLLNYDFDISYFPGVGSPRKFLGP